MDDIKNRLNSNIYKNIFPDEPFNMDYINRSMENTVTSSNDIKQENHGLNLYDVVYLDIDGYYKKALAEDSKKGIPCGIVSHITGINIFTLMQNGMIEYNVSYLYEDTSILYLSDKVPGKLVHYKEIENTIYIPIGVYTKQGFIINIEQGSIGDALQPYGIIEQNFESYSVQELNQFIQEFRNKVIT